MIQKVWVLVEEDRGAGSYVIGVYYTQAQAEEAVISSYCYIQECEIE